MNTRERSFIVFEAMRGIRGIGTVLMFLSMGMRCRTPTKGEPRPEAGCFQGDVVNVSCDTLYSASPDLATDGRGNLYLVWGSLPSQYDYNNLRCVIRARVNGEWTRINTVSTGPTWGCFVAADPQGRVHVVWEERIGPGGIDPEYAVMYRMRRVDGTWSPPETVEIHVFIRQARVGVDPTGRVHVIWGGHYASRSPEGVWDVFEENVPIGENPFMTVDSVGGVHVVWGAAGMGDVLQYSLRTPAGTWETYPVGRMDAAPHGVSIFQGKIWVCGLLRGTDPTPRDVEVVCYRGQKGEWAEVPRPVDYGAYDVATVGGGGQAVVVYWGHVEGANSDTLNMAVRFFDGVGWSPARVIRKFDQGRPPVVFSPVWNQRKGNFFLVWTETLYDESRGRNQWYVFLMGIEPGGMP